MCKLNSGITPPIYFGKVIGPLIMEIVEGIYSNIDTSSPTATKAILNEFLLAENEHLKGYEEKFNFTIDDIEGGDQKNQRDYFDQNLQMFKTNAWKPQNRIPVMFSARNVNEDVKSELLTNNINNARSMLS
jgi:hypothetical protein